MTGFQPGKAVTAVMAGLSLAVAGSFLGALHPLGDSLAVFRAHLSVLLVMVALAALFAGRRRRGGVAGAALGLAGLASLVPHHLAPPAPQDVALTLYQKNLQFQLADPAALVADMRAAAPDIITLQEVSGISRPILAALAAEYPTRVDCPFSGVGGPAVLSRFPALPGAASCHDGDGAASVVLQTPCGPVRVISLHLHWPWPLRQGEQVARLSPGLAGDAPTLLAGDFNMVQWSHTVRAIGRVTGTVPVNPSRNTLPDKVFGLSLPIDHVLAPARAGIVELRPRLGSDHRGLFARLPCP